MTRLLSLLLLALMMCSCRSGDEEVELDLGVDDLLYSVAHTFPDYREFLTVAELGMFSDTAVEKLKIRRERIVEGTDPVDELQIGDGATHVLLSAFPSASEAYGSMTLAYLVEELATNKRLAAHFAGVTWHILLCASPAGARLNEGWFKGTLTLRRFLTAYYGLPADGAAGVVSESAYNAIRGVMDRYPIAAAVALRGDIFGDAHIGTSRLVAGVSEQLRQVLEVEGFVLSQKPLQTFDPDVKGVSAVALTSLIHGPHADKLFVDLWLPQFFAPNTAEGGEVRPIPVDHVDAQQTADFLDASYGKVKAALSEEWPFQASFEAWTTQLHRLLDLAEKDAGGAKSAGDQYEAWINIRTAAIIALSQYVRLLESERAKGFAPFPTQAAEDLAQAEERLNAAIDLFEEELDYTLMSIQHVGRAQVLVALYLVDYLQRNR